MERKINIFLVMAQVTWYVFISNPENVSAKVWKTNQNDVLPWMRSEDFKQTELELCNKSFCRNGMKNCSAIIFTFYRVMASCLYP